MSADPQPYRPKPAGPVNRGLLVSGSIQLSPELIVVTDGNGRQAWLAGPAAGGVVSAVLAPDAVILRDHAGSCLAQLEGEAWIGTPEGRDDLARRLTGLGVRVVDEPAGWSAAARSFAGPLVSPPPAIPPILRGVEARGVPGNILLLPALTTVATMAASAGSGFVFLVAGGTVLGGTVLVGGLRVVVAAWATNRRSSNVAAPSLADRGVRHG